MVPKDWREYVKIEKEKYKKLGHVECPVFGNEPIFFNQKGFRHLVMKQGKYRSRKEQIRRISLLPQIISTITSAKNIHSFRVIEGVKLWSISKLIGDTLIIVVIRQISSTSQKHFLSVMDKKLPRNAKTPFGAS